MDNMFDTLNWSTSWDSPIGGPQMMNGWDYNSMQTWVGAPQAEEPYFGFGYSEDATQMAFDMDMQASHPTEIMNGHYGQMEQRHPI